MIFFMKNSSLQAEISHLRAVKTKLALKRQIPQSLHIIIMLKKLISSMMMYTCSEKKASYVPGGAMSRTQTKLSNCMSFNGYCIRKPFVDERSTSPHDSRFVPITPMPNK